MTPTVAVCGTGTPLSPDLARHAHALGAALWQAGFTIITGGLGGVMEAACRGAFEARAQAGDVEASAARGRLIVGILPGADKLGANRYCDLVIPTGLGEARNLLVVRSADVVVLVAGGAGTLAEAALAWQLGRPLLALVPTGGWAAALAGRAVDDRRPGAVEPVHSAAEAAARARELVAARGV
ncbi:MAG TPA: TIGR00725 family protein [Polyangia bacterium]|nr:TIGR00725 family protein [Polyangia bacterium]